MAPAPRGFGNISTPPVLVGGKFAVTNGITTPVLPPDPMNEESAGSIDLTVRGPVHPFAFIGNAPHFRWLDDNFSTLAVIPPFRRRSN
jgi:hypothetical protein